MTTPYGSNPTATYTGFIGEVWSQKINAGLDQNCVMLQCVNRDWQSEAEKGSKAINIISPTAVTAANYTGTIASYGTLTGGPTVLNLDQNVYFGLSVPDIDQSQSNANIVETIITKANQAVEQAIDQYIFSMYTNANSSNQIGSAASPQALTPATIYNHFVDLAKRLKVAGAINNYNTGWVVVHPAVEQILLLSTQFASSSTLGDNSIKNGSIGKIAGLDVYVSANVGDLGSSKYLVLAGTKQGITYASQLEKVEIIRAESSFDSIVRGLYTFGALTLNAKALATITCTVSTTEPVI